MSAFKFCEDIACLVWIHVYDGYHSAQTACLKQVYNKIVRLWHPNNKYDNSTSWTLFTFRLEQDGGLWSGLSMHHPLCRVRGPSQLSWCIWSFNRKEELNRGLELLYAKRLTKSDSDTINEARATSRLGYVRLVQTFNDIPFRFSMFGSFQITTLVITTTRALC